jgi:CheY-like chemotaxis protein
MCPVNQHSALLPRRDWQALNVLVIASSSDAHEIEEMLKGAVIAEAERFEQRDRFAVHCVADLDEAVRALASWSFDVVLLDRDQPDAQGSDTVQWCAGFSELLPVILLCETADGAISQDAIAAGIQACLHRDGFDLSELPQIVLRSIDNHALIAMSEAVVIH